jgi:hypothetical protein
LASRSGGEVIPFICYALQGFLDGLRAQIAIVREQQFELTWQDFLESQFGRTASDLRRKQLLIELAHARAVVPKASLRDLSATLAVMYAGKTDKTLNRDLNWATAADLIEHTDAGYRANVEIVSGFLPLRAT